MRHARLFTGLEAHAHTHTCIHYHIENITHSDETYPRERHRQICREFTDIHRGTCAHPYYIRSPRWHNRCWNHPPQNIAYLYTAILHTRAPNMFDLVCGLHCAQSLCAIGSNGPGGEISRNLSVGKASEDISRLVAPPWWLGSSWPFCGCCLGGTTLVAAGFPSWWTVEHHHRSGEEQEAMEGCRLANSSGRCVEETWIVLNDFFTLDFSHFLDI